MFAPVGSARLLLRVSRGEKDAVRRGMNCLLAATTAAAVTAATGWKALSSLDAPQGICRPLARRKVAARWLPYDPGQDLGIHDVTIEFSPRTAFDSVSMLNDRLGHYFGEPAIPLAILVVLERAIDGFAGTRSSDEDAARRR